MHKIDLRSPSLSLPRVAVGCMRICAMEEKELSSFIELAMENGANFFDHADIYGAGHCEEVFARAASPFKREDMILQTKCSIVPGRMYDLSYEHIISSVDKSLKRLGTDYIDILLLHRPDALVEPEEVARAFEELSLSGKVRHFGVSNHNPYQIELLQSALSMPIAVNQLQFGLGHTSMVDLGINVNTMQARAIDRDGGSLDYCRLKGITVQAWSPLQYGFFEGCFIDNDKFPELNCKLSELSEKYNADKTAISIAWILRHPAKIQAVTGTTNKERLLSCIKAADITLTREEWYELYRAAGNTLP